MATVVPSSSFVDVEHLRKDYQVRTGILSRAVLRAVDDVSLGIPRGTTLGLVGESGCGKTTVGRCILRLTEPTSGSVRLDGVEVVSLGPKELRRFRKRMQAVFQDPAASLSPRMTVGAMLREPLALEKSLSGSEIDERTFELVRRVGLDRAHLNRYPHQFSGGQQQRIAIARALARRPDFLVFDEPTSALDVSVRGQILMLITGLQQRFGLSYLFISHDLSVVRHVCHQVAVMYLGAIVEEGTADEIFSEPGHPYTRALIAAVPIPDLQDTREGVRLQGEVPSPINVPPGCRLYPRCPFRREECLDPQVPWAMLSPTHRVRCILGGDWSGPLQAHSQLL